MSREIRHVPRDWKHPKGAQGEYIPLEGYSFAECLAEWKQGKAKWDEGFVHGADGFRPRKDTDGDSFEDWDGPCPVESDYMPDWPESKRTHIQMYESCSEGTPISPVMKSPKALARWLADNGASAFGKMTATYDQWLAMIQNEWAPSMIMTDGVIESGVAAIEKKGA